MFGIYTDVSKLHPLKYGCTKDFCGMYNCLLSHATKKCHIAKIYCRSLSRNEFARGFLTTFHTEGRGHCCLSCGLISTKAEINQIHINRVIRSTTVISCITGNHCANRLLKHAAHSFIKSTFFFENFLITIGLSSILDGSDFSVSRRWL